MITPSVIPVRLPHRPPGSYIITIAPGLLRSLPQLAAQQAGRGGIFVVTDTTVGRLYGRDLLRDLHDAGLEARLLDVPPGEKSKSQVVLGRLHTALLRGGIRRSDLILALGGGVVGDLAGFAACTVLRGVPWVLVPTTLLAQVDSSVGGKVAVNHPDGKNLLGAFHQPAAVWIDPGVLSTLPVIEYRCGLAEAVKIALALDGGFFAWLESTVALLRVRDKRAISVMLARALGLKAGVIRKDERDGGVRKVLNMGHTIGHALEAANGYALRHGLAVSLGLVTESALSVDMGFMTGAQRDRLVSLLRNLGLPVRVPPLSPAKARKAAAALRLDKKGSTGSTPSLVLPAGIGCAAMDVEIGVDRLLRHLSGGGST